MKRLLIFVVFCLTCCALRVCSRQCRPLLPKSFAGWTADWPSANQRQSAQADPAYPAVLQEYGFADSETATYTRDDGRKLTIKAARFNDATGAYGAFTFYRQPAMRTEQIGTKAASANDRILFFRSNLLVDASFDRVTEMSAAELRELAGMLPAASGSADNLPTLPEYLPKNDVVENSAKYILGPQALLAVKAPLTAERGRLQSRARNSDAGLLVEGRCALTLTLIQYPTPQIAGDRLRALQSAEQSSSGLSARQTQRAAGRCGDRRHRQRRCARLC